MGRKKKKEPEIDREFYALSTKYLKLFELSKTVQDVDPKEWTLTCSLAYFLYRYRKMFGVDYVLEYKEAPSRSIEYASCRRIWQMLGATSSEGYKMKAYLDWFFDNYTNNRFKTIFTLAKPSMIAQYQYQKKVGGAIKTTDPLPEDIVEALKKYPHDNLSYMRTYGDLYFLKKALEAQFMRKEAAALLAFLLANNFDTSILDSFE